MGTLGEIARWVGITIDSVRTRLRQRYRRLAARLLGRDPLLAGSERKFSALVEAAPDAIVIVDWHGHIKLFNEQAERLFGWRREEIIGQPVGELIPEQARTAHHGHLRGYVRDPRTRPMGVEMELYGRRKNGSLVPVEISLGPLQTDQGLLVSAALRDITDRKRAEAALREAEERFRTAFEEAPGGMALASLDGRLLKVNRALCAITGYSREQLESTTLSSITHPDEVNQDETEIKRLVSGDASHYRAERRYMHAAGHPVPVDLSVAVIRAEGGVSSHFLAQVHDITERKRFEGQLQYLADHDALTGMYNRRRFEQELERELARAARYGTRWRGLGDRPRPLQIRQRHAGSLGRRRADQPRGEHLPQPAAQHGRDRAARRRRVRGDPPGGRRAARRCSWARTCSARCAKRGACPPRPGIRAG